MTRLCRSCSIMLASAILCFGIGCTQEGPTEQAGKKVDETVEKAGQVMEESKEKMEEGVEKTKEMGQEAVEKVEEAAK
jgi:hypothetical protein